MRLLYLIRHASPNIRPDTPARDWTLSERGIAEAQALAATAEGWGLGALYSSSETKARATALILGDALGLNVNVVDAFDELRIPEFVANADAFNELIRAILEGRGTDEELRLEPRLDARAAETASAAADRFATGVRIVEQGPFPAAVISHGRILTAYLAGFAGLDEPYELWRTIPMPGWTSVDLDAPRRGLLTPFSG